MACMSAEVRGGFLAWASKPPRDSTNAWISRTARALGLIETRDADRSVALENRGPSNGIVAEGSTSRALAMAAAGISVRPEMPTWLIARRGAGSFGRRRR